MAAEADADAVGIRKATIKPLQGSAQSKLVALPGSPEPR